MDQRVRAILTETPRCRINLVGPPGSGKSTAIVHLRATIGMPEELRVIDDQHQSGMREPFLLTSRVPESADDAIGSVDAALPRFLDRELSDPAIMAAAEYRALVAVAPWGLVGREPPPDVTGEPLRRVMRYGPITTIMAARWLAEGLRDGSTRAFLCERLPLEVIRRVGKIARSSPDAIRALDLITQETVPGAHASLHGCGLAESDWEGADLRDADLRGSTFHMGTTRSGLVGSSVPCEGSRTGFYTDEFHDRDFKDPAEIRKANLCRADLRGANVDGVDFYLVDLREAQYSEAQGDWFRRCGAILSDG